MINCKFFSVCLAVLVFMMVPSVGTSAMAASHPYHVSSAEIHWNPTTGNFEVALCVWPADLEKAISIQQKRSIDLDAAHDLDALLEQYIATRFTIEPVAGNGLRQKFEETIDANSQIVRLTDQKTSDVTQESATSQQVEISGLRWVGHEMDLQKAWLYFEIRGDKTAGGWKIENRVFFELNEDQINQIQVSNGGLPQSVGLSASQTRLEFQTELPSESKVILIK